jgi:hypothetical protein|tara:strand:+ start:600 stop:893 length:294 start_codon:yes stop_codon:yes gene_type:complete
LDFVTLDINGGTFRPTEILSDLRIAAETLYSPMKMVGFWDSVQEMHLCPQVERRQPCLHNPDDPGEKFLPYVETLAKERQATLALLFKHSGITVYLS